MSLSHSPSIITNGLVLCLDAANRKSYPGSGTTWTDLSGRGNNGTLVNGVGYNGSNLGSLVFDGSNDYVDVGPNSNFSFGTGNFTIECWVWRNGSQSENAGIVISYPNIFGSAPLTSWQLSMGSISAGNNQNKLVFYIGGQTDFRLDDPDVFPNQTWTYIVATRLGSTVSLYKNTSIVDSSTSSQNLSDDDIAIGINRGGTAILNGLISNVRIYNRALTAQEIQQNFNATRSRYGI
jgi:hypothetical protein